MAEFRTILRTDIIVPERLREVDEDQALVLSTQIAQQGLINPITVRKTPPATKPFRKYTLVAGAHRLRGVEMLQRAEIDAMIVEADALDALILEIAENLFRHDLSALDRAIFVVKYREAWEQKHGQINPKGGRPRNGDKLSSFSTVNILDAIDAMEGSTFFEHAAERLGLHPRSVKRALFIGQKLTPELRKVVRGTRAADNQSMLEKLAGMEPERQRLVATAFTDTPDIKRAIDLTDPHAKAKVQQSAQQELLSRLISTWARADEKTKAAFLEHVGASAKKPREKPTLTALLAEADAGGIMSPDPRQVTIFDVIGSGERP